MNSSHSEVTPLGGERKRRNSSYIFLILGALVLLTSVAVTVTILHARAGELSKRSHPITRTHQTRHLHGAPVANSKPLKVLAGGEPSPAWKGGLPSPPAKGATNNELQTQEHASLSVGAYQGAMIIGNKTANLKKIAFYAKAAAKIRIDLLVLPELSTIGYGKYSKSSLRALAESRDGPTFKNISSMAKEHKIAIVYGYAELDGSDVHNVAVLVDGEGRRLIHYRKVHLTYMEAPLFTPGHEIGPVAKLKGVSIGLLICYDMFMPEASRVLALKGADVIAAPAANSDLYEMEFVSQKAVPLRAVENGVAIVYVNYAQNATAQGGPSYFFPGMSVMVDPKGSVMQAGRAFARPVPPSASGPGGLMPTPIDNNQVQMLVGSVMPGMFPFKVHRHPEAYGALTDSQYAWLRKP